MRSLSLARKFRATLARRTDDFLKDLQWLVNTDSGTYCADGVNRVADWCSARMELCGFECQRTPTIDQAGRLLGDLLDCRYTGSGDSRLLVLAHMDTVFPEGTVAQRPFSTDGRRAYGPGVTDMKGGLLLGIHAMEAVLAHVPAEVIGEVRFLFTPDEEVGTPVSKPLLRRIAQETDACLVLEAAREDGAIVSSRRGCTQARLTIAGRSAHAGVEPERGRNAIVEGAHKALALAELNARFPGSNVTVGVIRGGIQSNVVPDLCELEVDLRAASEQELKELENSVQAVAQRQYVDGVTTSLQLTSWQRPMERTLATERLLLTARLVADDLGFDLVDVATGGSSDACTIASCGVPTLDGLGPIGGDDHGPNEWLDLESVVPRAALLAGLIEQLTTADPAGLG